MNKPLLFFLSFISFTIHAVDSQTENSAIHSPNQPAPLSSEKMVKLLKGIDLRIRSAGDYKALFYLEQREKNKPDMVREGLAYRRDADEKLMILFTKPKMEAGKGYLRIDKTCGTMIHQSVNGNGVPTASA